MNHSKTLPIPVGVQEKERKYKVVYENGYFLNQSVLIPNKEPSPQSIFMHNLKQRMQVYGAVQSLLD